MVDERIARRIVALMNEALEADAEAVTALVVHRTPCNASLVAHPTIQAGACPGPLDPPSVGLLGILNGIAGADDEDHWGAVVAICDNGTGDVLRFEILEDRIQHQE